MPASFRGARDPARMARPQAGSVHRRAPISCPSRVGRFAPQRPKTPARAGTRLPIRDLLSRVASARASGSRVGYSRSIRPVRSAFASARPGRGPHLSAAVPHRNRYALGPGHPLPGLRISAGLRTSAPGRKGRSHRVRIPSRSAAKGPQGALGRDRRLNYGGATAPSWLGRLAIARVEDAIRENHG